MVATALITSFSIPGIPGGSIIAMVPVLTSVGVPVDGLGILLGVDTLPDMVRTTANVTGQLATPEQLTGSAVGGEGVNRLSLFVGPKDLDILKKVNPKL